MLHSRFRYVYIYICISAHWACSCHVPWSHHVPFVSSLRWPFVALARLDCFSDNQTQRLSAETQEQWKAKLHCLSDNQTQRLSAETEGQRSARLTKMRDTSRQHLNVYTLFPLLYLLCLLIIISFAFIHCCMSKVQGMCLRIVYA